MIWTIPPGSCDMNYVVYIVVYILCTTWYDPYRKNKI